MEIIVFHWQLRVFNGDHEFDIVLTEHSCTFDNFFTIDPLGSKLTCYLFVFICSMSSMSSIIQ